MRRGWDEYFMNIAAQCATRATCDRKHVGAVIVRDRSILSTGYNGAARGLAHCDDVGHLMVDGHCVRTIHAEANAILQAARNGVRLDGGEIYTTASPCLACFIAIANTGLKRIVYGEDYRDDRSFTFAKQLGIELVHMPLPARDNDRVLATLGLDGGLVKKPLAELRASDVPRGMDPDDLASDLDIEARSDD
jgi:dCMP deaminase